MSWYDCVLINRYEIAIRIKHLLQLVIINKNLSAEDYLKYLNSFTKDNGILEMCGFLFIPIKVRF